MKNQFLMPACLMFTLIAIGCSSSVEQGVNTSAVVNNSNFTHPPVNVNVRNTSGNIGTNGQANTGTVANANNENKSLLNNISNAVFNPPETMKLHQTEHIQLLLSPTHTSEELKALIVEGAGSTLHTVENIRTSDRVEAVLTGSAFKITELSPREQDIAQVRDVPVEWKWEVKALEDGRHRLDLTLNSVIYNGSVPSRRTIKSHKAEIFIDVTWQDRVTAFVSENWQWLWAALIVPVAPILFARLRRRRSE